MLTACLLGGLHVHLPRHGPSSNRGLAFHEAKYSSSMATPSCKSLSIASHFPHVLRIALSAHLPLIPPRLALARPTEHSKYEVGEVRKCCFLYLATTSSMKYYGPQTKMSTVNTCTASSSSVPIILPLTRPPALRRLDPQSPCPAYSHTNRSSLDAQPEPPLGRRRSPPLDAGARKLQGRSLGTKLSARRAQRSRSRLTDWARTRPPWRFVVGRSDRDGRSQAFGGWFVEAEQRRSRTDSGTATRRSVSPTSACRTKPWSLTASHRPSLGLM